MNLRVLDTTSRGVK